MISYLKKQLTTIDSLGCTLTLCELSAQAHMQISEARGAEGTMESVFLVCKFGVDEWREASTQEIAQNVPVMAVNEIAAKVYALSGVDAAKNSERAPGVDSSSDSA